MHPSIAVITLRLLTTMLLAGGVLSACSRQPALEADPFYGRGGHIEWLHVSEGRLKAELYATTPLSAHPILVVFLHGDLPNPTPSYQYAFAQAITQGIDSPAIPERARAQLAALPQLQDVMAAGFLRPGYTDNQGDRSDGDMGNAAGDNYTPEVVDAIALAVTRLKTKYAPRRVVLVGHSGGAAIAAGVLSRRPEVANAALLIACGCDPDAGRARMRLTRPNPMWKGATRSLQPIELAASVQKDIVVRLISGTNDDVALPEYSTRYAAALQGRGVDARVTLVPGAGHNIVFSPAVFAELIELLHGM
jgi:pimeloyl-ACP methyl ester carboxylesterase